MADNRFLLQYLKQYFDEIDPITFYRALFPLGSLGTAQLLLQGKYNAIAVALRKTKEQTKVKRYLITDDLQQLIKLLNSKDFVIISPISYAGKSRQSKNARFIYALAIDLDGLETRQNIEDLFYQIENEILPRPTYVVWSGTGLHLYYQFIEPLPCFKNIVKQLTAMKQDLTKKIWNKYITTEYQKPQIQSLFQGFRMVGTQTKGKDVARAFDVGGLVDIEYLNKFVSAENRLTEYRYKSKMTLEQAAAKYPQWFEDRVINNRPRGTWKNKRDLYNWWLRRLQEEIMTGHRYYGVMVLAIYAKKCGVPREELEKDAFALLPKMEELTTDESNHFTSEDILAALEMYNDNYITFPIHSIETLTALKIERNKRNGRKQDVHLKIMRSNKRILKEEGLLKEGRPSKAAAIEKWQKDNPTGTKADCAKETGISRPTINKWWKEIY